MAREVVYLVIGADRRVRAAKRPQIREDEIAIRINVTFPDSWGRVVSNLDIEVPDFSPVVGEIEAIPPVSGKEEESNADQAT